MNDYDMAMYMAGNAHRGQVDKGGLPYLLHPLHVASFFGGERKILAVLHDAVEDSPLTMADLEGAGFSQRVLDGVSCLTRSRGEDYDRYINNLSKNPDAVAVKLRDLEHNMDLTRLPHLDEKCWPRLLKYHSAYKFLENV